MTPSIVDNDVFLAGSIALKRTIRAVAHGAKNSNGHRKHRSPISAAVNASNDIPGNGNDWRLSNKRDALSPIHLLPPCFDSRPQYGRKARKYFRGNEHRTLISINKHRSNNTVSA